MFATVTETPEAGELGELFQWPGVHALLVTIHSLRDVSVDVRGCLESIFLTFTLPY